MKGQKKFIPTEEQIAWLRANAASMDYEQMAAHLNCCARTVGRCLKAFGLIGLKIRAWSDEDERILREMAGSHSVTAICSRLGRDWETVVPRARQLGIDLSFDRWWPPEKVARLRELAAAGRTRHQIADEMGERYQNIRNAVQRFSVVVVREYSNQYKGNARPERARRTRAARPPKTAPRERIGIPQAIRRGTYQGTVAYCDRCHAPVIDTPTRWAEHNLRVHPAPIRRIA